ncbi:MAG TPA: ATP-binding protein [Gaiella sp.]|nr:ATP-binding protein [Gaiella sp.]
MSANVVRLVMPAKTEYLIVARLALAGIAREVPMGDSVLADLKLAVTEACGNAVRYARPSDESVILVKFTIDDGSIEICVEDEGPGPGSVVVREGRAPVSGDLSESGMGLAIIRALVDELEIRGRDDAQGTLLRMRKRLTAG